MFIGMRLAKAGFCGGDPLRVIHMPVDVVVGMLEYEAFEADYESEYCAINKPSTT
jgi:hypothetical protein